MTANDHILFQDIQRHITMCKAQVVSRSEVMEGKDEKEFTTDLINALGILQRQIEVEMSKETTNAG